jgi:hypothetical protein
MQLVTLFKLVEVLIDSPAGCTLQFFTDMPGDALTVRVTDTIAATAGRHPHRMVLPGFVKGKLYQMKITPTGGVGMSIYSAKVYARPLGPPPAPWAWYSVPGIFATQDDWTAMKLPIEQTSDQYQALKLPVEVTPEEYTALKLPIDPTSETYSSMALPVKPTPVVPEWVSVQVDQ